MKRKLLVFLSLAAMVASIGCFGDSGDSDSGSSGSGNGTATVQGNVTDTTGALITNAQLTTGDVTTTSNAGAFTLANIAIPSDGTVKITISRNGSLTTYAFEPVANGQTLVATYTLKTIAAGSINTLNMAAPLPAYDNGRLDTKIAKVELAANSILGSDGNPVTTANVTVVNQVPGDTSYADVFPGVFAGVRTNGTTTPFESYGFVSVDLGTGNKLDPSKPATLTIPIAAGNTPTDATIPLWSYNPATGKWVEEGVATRQDLGGGNIVYVGQVTHFSTYNLDKPFTGGNFVVNVASGSLVVSSAKVTMTSTWSANNQSGVWKDIRYTDATGKATFSVPAGKLDITAEKDSKTAKGYMYDLTGSNASATIDINNPFSHGGFVSVR